jgi:hypothetical protein
MLLHLVLLVCVLVLFLHDLVHKRSLVHTLGRVETRCPLSVSLQLVLAAHGDRTKSKKFVLAEFKLTYSWYKLL